MEKGEFTSLSTFKDDKAMIRVGGRLDKAIVSYEEKHRISLLITEYMHRLGHHGAAITTAKQEGSIGY